MDLSSEHKKKDERRGKIGSYLVFTGPDVAVLEVDILAGSELWR